MITWDDFCHRIWRTREWADLQQSKQEGDGSVAQRVSQSSSEGLSISAGQHREEAVSFGTGEVVGLPDRRMGMILSDGQ